MRILAFLILFLSGAASFLAARDVVLRPATELNEGFVRLSDLSVNGEKDLRRVFLGSVKNGEERVISLDYIHQRMRREGIIATPIVSGETSGAVRVIGSDSPSSNAGQPSGLSLPETVTLRQQEKDDGMTAMVVLRSAMKRGDILTPDMVELKRFKNPVPGCLVNPEDVGGMELTRNLRAGEILRDSYIKQPPLVERGEHVKVLYQNDAIVISGLGKALDEGAMGDIIDVRRDHSVLQCKVTGKQLVQVIK